MKEPNARFAMYRSHACLSMYTKRKGERRVERRSGGKMLKKGRIRLIGMSKERYKNCQRGKGGRIFITVLKDGCRPGTLAISFQSYRNSRGSKEE
jgi:hypothetical protein